MQPILKKCYGDYKNAFYNKTTTYTFIQLVILPCNHSKGSLLEKDNFASSYPSVAKRNNDSKFLTKSGNIFHFTQIMKIQKLFTAKKHFSFQIHNHFSQKWTSCCSNRVIQPLTIFPTAAM